MHYNFGSYRLHTKEMEEMIVINWTVVFIGLFIIAAVVAVVQTIKIRGRNTDESNSFKEAGSYWKELKEYEWKGLQAFQDWYGRTPQSFKWSILDALCRAKSKPAQLDRELDTTNSYQALDSFTAAKAGNIAEVVLAEILSMSSTEDVHELAKSFKKLVDESGKGESAFVSETNLDKAISGTILVQARYYVQRLGEQPSLQSVQDLSAKLGQIPRLADKTTALNRKIFDEESATINIDFRQIFKDVADYCGAPQLELPSDDAEELDKQAAPTPAELAGAELDAPELKATIPPESELVRDSF